MSDDVRKALIFVFWYLALLLVVFAIVDATFVRGGDYAQAGDDLHNILFGGF
jgi:hypothetical protein